MVFELSRAEWIWMASVIGFIVFVNKVVIHDGGSTAAGLLVVSFALGRLTLQAVRWTNTRRRRRVAGA